jgi:hypothetical protein
MSATSGVVRSENCTLRRKRSWRAGAHLDGGAHLVRRDGDVSHCGADQLQAVAAVRNLTRWAPSAAVGDGDAEAGTADFEPDADNSLPGAPIPVLDGVGTGLAGGDQDILGHDRVQAQLAEPAAELPPDCRKLVRISVEGEVQRFEPAQ